MLQGCLGDQIFPFFPRKNIVEESNPEPNIENQIELSVG